MNRHFKNFNDHKSKLDKIDLIVIFILTFIYSIIAFSNLGTFSNPQTFKEYDDNDNSSIIQVDNDDVVSHMIFYAGREFNYFDVYVSNDNLNYNYVSSIEPCYSFSWNDYFFNYDKKFSYVKLISRSSSNYIGEISFYDSSNNKLSSSVLDNSDITLIDESDTVPVEISYLNSAYFDEVYFPRAAFEYVHNLETYEWVHPPLGKLIISIPIMFFGMNTFSYRFMGVLAGILMIPVIYIFSKKLFKERKYALLAGIIMAFDSFHFVQTRLGTVDSFLVLFIMLSALFMYQYVELGKEDSFKSKIINLSLSAFFIGLAISVKWSSLYAGLGLCIAFFTDLFINKKKYMPLKDIIKLVLICGLLFISIPFIIYILCYLLFPNVSYYTDNSISGIFNQISNMYSYHSNLTEGHPFSSMWYTWPFMIKPVWYYVSNYSNGVSTIVGIGNPVIWWFGILSSLFTIVHSIIKKKKNILFISLFIVCTWLPYMFINRPMFLYHFFPTLPFIMLSIVYFIKWINKKFNNNRFYIMYIILVILFFIVFYPVVSGIVVDPSYVDKLKWLSSWYF